MRRFWPIFLVILWSVSSASAEQMPHDAACPLQAMLCPDGSHVVRIGPYCEFAPCPDDTPATFPGMTKAITPFNLGLSKYMDLPLGNGPMDPEPVPYIVYHRTALDRQRVTVRGTVVRTLPNRRIVIADTADRNRDHKTDIVVALPPNDENNYEKGETVDIPATVWGSKTGVMLMGE
jgi:hypothetical protein